MRSIDRYKIQHLLYGLVFVPLRGVLIPLVQSCSTAGCPTVQGTAQSPSNIYQLIDGFVNVQHPATKRYDLSHVRFCISGAAPLSSELTQQLMKVIPNAQIGQGYGMFGFHRLVLDYLLWHASSLPSAFDSLYGQSP